MLDWLLSFFIVVIIGVLSSGLLAGLVISIAKMLLIICITLLVSSIVSAWSGTKTAKRVPLKDEKV